MKKQKTLKQLKKQYDEARREYRQRLLDEVKKKLWLLLARTSSKTISYAELCDEGLFDILGKYETPKNYAGNYILKRFGLDESENLYAEAEEMENPDSEWTFSEYDFDISELEQVNDDLKTILSDDCYKVDPETGEITHEE